MKRHNIVVKNYCMYLKHTFLSLSICALCTMSASAQDSISFKPSGKVIAQSFFDYTAGFGSANSKSSFNLTRAYLGYNYQITSELRAQLIIDGAAENTSAGKYELNVKNAFLEWNKGDLKVSVGMIGLTQFNLQEKYWQHRYVEKTFQDRTKMSSSADLGVSASYRVHPMFSVDASIINGEGYRTVSRNNSNKYTLGVNVYPIKNFVLRGFVATYSDSENLRATNDVGSDVSYGNENTLSIFAGYQAKKLSAGVEFSEVYNKGFIKKRNYYGCSAFAMYKVSSQAYIYGRYDYLESTNPLGYTTLWSEFDGHLFIAGLGYSPLKQVRVSPNFRLLNQPHDKAKPYAFVNFEFNL